MRLTLAREATALSNFHNLLQQVLVVSRLAIPKCGEHAI